MDMNMQAPFVLMRIGHPNPLGSLENLTLNVFDPFTVLKYKLEYNTIY